MMSSTAKASLKPHISSNTLISLCEKNIIFIFSIICFDCTRKQKGKVGNLVKSFNLLETLINCIYRSISISLDMTEQEFSLLDH